MSSHNSKYYAKSLKTNPVKSKSIVSLFTTTKKRKAEEAEDCDSDKTELDHSDNESIYIIRVAEQWESLCSQAKILNLHLRLIKIKIKPGVTINLSSITLHIMFRDHNEQFKK